jgi:hypothetical protein
VRAIATELTFIKRDIGGVSLQFVDIFKFWLKSHNDGGHFMNTYMCFCTLVERHSPDAYRSDTRFE